MHFTGNTNQRKTEARVMDSIRKNWNVDVSYTHDPNYGGQCLVDSSGLVVLKRGGRAAMIVPDGVLFGSTGAHRALRKLLVDDNQLEAVISLPSGVFKPYAGVSTGILVFTKGGRTDNVFFYDVEADGLSLDDKREPVEQNDLPDCLARWKARNPKRDIDRTAKAFFVPASEIREANYDLSLGFYKSPVYQEERYDSPQIILSQMKAINDEIVRDLVELEEMLQ
jgi:type I restriction enzyme M protein